MKTGQALEQKTSALQPTQSGCFCEIILLFWFLEQDGAQKASFRRAKVVLEGARFVAKFTFVLFFGLKTTEDPPADALFNRAHRKCLTFFLCQAVLCGTMPSIKAHTAKLERTHWVNMPISL